MPSPLISPPFRLMSILIWYAMRALAMHTQFSVRTMTRNRTQHRAQRSTARSAIQPIQQGETRWARRNCKHTRLSAQVPHSQLKCSITIEYGSGNAMHSFRITNLLFFHRAAAIGTAMVPLHAMKRTSVCVCVWVCVLRSVWVLSYVYMLYAYTYGIRSIYSLAILYRCDWVNCSALSRHWIVSQLNLTSR